MCFLAVFVVNAGPASAQFRQHAANPFGANKLTKKTPWLNLAKDSLSKPAIILSGYARIYGEYQESANEGYYYPSYGYALAEPTLTFGLIPVTGRLYYTTFPSLYNTGPFQYSIRFDAEKFNTNLRTALTEKVKKRADSMTRGLNNQVLEKELKEAKDLLADTVYARKLRELDRFAKLTDTAALMQSLRDSLERFPRYELKKLERMRDTSELSAGQEQIYMELKKKEGRIKELQEKAGRYRDLARYRDAYEANKARMKSINEKLAAIRESEKSLADIRPSKLYNKDSLKQRLKENGLLSPGLNSLFGIKRLQAGRINPGFHSSIMQGYPLDGVEVEYHANNILVHVVKGFSRMPEIRSIQKIDAGKSDLSAVKAGYGSQEGSHIYLMYFEGHKLAEDERYIKNMYRPPLRDNYIAGMDGRVDIGKNAHVGAEIFQSQSWLFSAQEADNSTIDLIAGFGRKIKGINEFSDFAGKLSSAISIPAAGIEMKGQAYQIGFNYRSLAVPFLPSDRQGYRLSVEKTFWEKQVTLSSEYWRETDNLENNKTGRTETMQLQSSLFIDIDPLPTLMVSYAPSRYLTTSDDKTSFTIASRYLLVTAIQPFYFGEFSGTISVTGLLFHQKMDIFGEMANRSLTAQGSLNYSQKAQSIFSMQHICQNTSTYDNNSLVITKDFRYAWTRKISTSSGLRYAQNTSHVKKSTSQKLEYKISEATALSLRMDYEINTSTYYRYTTYRVIAEFLYCF